MQASRNRTLLLPPAEVATLKAQLATLHAPAGIAQVKDKVLHQDVFQALDYLPDNFVDLLFTDPPYNMDKQFNNRRFYSMPLEAYRDWLDSWLGKCVRLLKPTASVYICGDWQNSAAIFEVISRYFKVRNRITFERDKGRGAKHNWKNCCEDIWFCTLGEDYYFDVDAVKIRRKVLAPYRDADLRPKDWQEDGGAKYRLTHPSNFWTDITIPFWSMPENTQHPTQKSEKLCAKVILASCPAGGMLFDPFVGSGTSAVVASKLGRHYCGVEIDEFYACLAQKRLLKAMQDPEIQGYYDGVFWPRNSQR